MQCGAGLTASSIADWHYAYIIPQQNRTDFTINILPDLQAASFEPYTTLQLSMSIYVLQKISVTSLPCIILCKAVHTKNFYLLTKCLLLLSFCHGMIIHRCEVTLLQTFDHMILAQHLRHNSSVHISTELTACQALIHQANLSHNQRKPDQCATHSLAI